MEIWPTIALVIFFVFFVGLIAWLVRIDKRHLHHMETMPLDGEEIAVSNNGYKHGGK
ncbi:MAG TPA: cytochrome C oxidase Cbb3 [bacterium]|nr:cytochrome C oxidase Cbb3 [bacterium]